MGSVALLGFLFSWCHCPLLPHPGTTTSSTTPCQVLHNDRGSWYNDFLHDPLSLCKTCDPQPNGENAISARSDLNPANGSYPFQALHQRSHGGIDVKVPTSGPGLLGAGGGQSRRHGSAWAMLEVKSGWEWGRPGLQLSGLLSGL
jgi:hypothetical protein